MAHRVYVKIWCHGAGFWPFYAAVVGLNRVSYRTVIDKCRKRSTVKKSQRLATRFMFQVTGKTKLKR
jgi:hypothetical protein